MQIDLSTRREIGVFDSGVGGFTVLRELRALLPHARLRYLADTAYAPYGSRTPEEIRMRSFAITARTPTSKSIPVKLTAHAAA